MDGPTIEVTKGVKVRTSIDYDVTDLTGLDSLFINEFYATSASSIEIKAKATAQLDVKLNNSIKATVSLTGKGSVDHIPHSFGPYSAVAEINSISLGSLVSAQVSTTKQELLYAVASGTKLTTQSFTLSCPAEADELCASFSAAATEVLQNSIDAKIASAVQDVINQQLQALVR